MFPPSFSKKLNLEIQILNWVTWAIVPFYCFGDDWLIGEERVRQYSVCFISSPNRGTSHHSAKKKGDRTITLSKLSDF